METTIQILLRIFSISIICLLISGFASFILNKYITRYFPKVKDWLFFALLACSITAFMSITLTIILLGIKSFII
jgi:hypothetical protein